MFIRVSLLGWVIAVRIRNTNHKKGLLKQPVKNLRQTDCSAVSATKSCKQYQGNYKIEMPCKGYFVFLLVRTGYFSYYCLFMNTYPSWCALSQK